MATVLTSSYQLISSRDLYSTSQGWTMTMRLYARQTATGEGSATGQFKYTIQPSVNFTGTWGNAGGVSVLDPATGSWSSRFTYHADGTMNEQTVREWSASFSGANEGKTWNVQAVTNYPWFGATDDNTRVGGDVILYTQPVGLSISNIVRGIDNMSATVSLTGWGGAGNSTNRYREFEIYTQGFVTPRRWQIDRGTLSSTITVNNSGYGDLTIVGNTMYTLGVYASNSVNSVGPRQIGDYTTLPPKDTLTLNSASATSLVINYSVPADGGKYAKTLQYSVNGGSTWTTYDTISGGSAKSSSFAISGLTPNTSYTIQSRVTTSAGTTTNTNITAATVGPVTPTISATVSGNSITWTYGTTSYGGGSNPRTVLYTGSANPPTWQADYTTTTGNRTHTISSLNYNTTYYARARSQADWNGTTQYSNYSTVVSSITGTQTPTISNFTLKEYQTVSTVKVKATISIPADGGALRKNLQYRYKLGSGAYTDWAVAATYTTGDAQTYTLELSNIPVSTLVTLQVQSATTAYQHTPATATYTTPGTHQGPTGFNFTVQDNNTSVQTWLSSFSGYTDPIFIQGKSRAKIVVPRASEGTTTDGATLVNYKSTIPSESANLTIAYVSGASDMTGMYSNGIPAGRITDNPSNNLTIKTSVFDSLSASTEVTKTVKTLSYGNPVLTMDGEMLSTPGNVRVTYEGMYARLQDSALNSGNDMNTLTLEYRVLDYEGTVITNWTTISDTTIVIDSNKPFAKDFNGSFTLSGISTTTSTTVEIRATDHFTTVTESFSFDVWNADRVIYPAEYDIELWDWKNNTFVADLSYLVIGDLNIDWELNNAEEVSFDIDLRQFEKKCDEMGVNPTDLLKPYAHDIRIRRNGTYILGCQLVEATTTISNNPSIKIGIKGTGFLNLFKDQYVMNEAWSGYSYSEIAKKLVQTAQRPDCLVKNPTLDIDTSYWLAVNGYLWSSGGAKEGSRCLGSARSGSGWITVGTQLSVGSGERISGTVWVKGTGGTHAYLHEREFITQVTGQKWITDITLNGSWQQITFTNYQTIFENPYIVIEMDDATSASRFYIDSFYPYQSSDAATLCNMNVALGTDTATAGQSKTREVNYELQNVKDAIIDLTSMEDDNFDFSFSPDRTFNVYNRKGSDNLDLEIGFPGNVDSMTITRSAANLANKIIALGSGIGDERLQYSIANTPSRQLYGTRESITTDSNISLEPTLRSKAIGTLYDRKDPTNIPVITIKDGTVNPSNIQTGDTIILNMYETGYLQATTGFYRVTKIQFSLTENDVEEMKLTVEPLPQRPEKQMVRYIRDIINGNTQNNGNYWVEIEALMLQGNEYVNIALNKTVTTSIAATEGQASYVTDGNTASNPYCGVGTGRQSVTIDLGAEYPIDYIRVWHYYGDNRTFKENNLSVGTALPGDVRTALGKVLWSYAGNAYQETANGRKSGWIQEDKIVNG